MILEDRAGYKLAVEQWSSANSVTSKTPLFFRWTNEPFRYVNGQKAEAGYTLLLGNV